MSARGTFCGDPNCHKDRERKMVLDKERGFHCDPCIAKIVAALNDAGLKTIASCCGHGFMPGFIALKDRREIIIARNFSEARMIDKLSPVDINGDPMPAYRLVGPGEMDAETLERAAQIADDHEGKPCGHASGWTEEQREFYDIGQTDATMSLAAKFRSLAKGGGDGNA